MGPVTRAIFWEINRRRQEGLKPQFLYLGQRTWDDFRLEPDSRLMQLAALGGSAKRPEFVGLPIFVVDDPNHLIVA